MPFVARLGTVALNAQTPREIAEILLAHSVGNAVERVPTNAGLS
jgi:hypothetical protein